jgi:hypothetical protein
LSLGRFWQFWAKSVVYAVAESFLILQGAARWKATIHIYHYKKFQKINNHIVFTTPCPKIKKTIFFAFVL